MEFYNNNGILFPKIFSPTTYEKKNGLAIEKTLMKFKAEGQEFEENWRLQEQFIGKVKSKKSFETEYFLTCFEGFLDLTHYNNYYSNWKK